jgi:hypothetical protein
MGIPNLLSKAKKVIFADIIGGLTLIVFLADFLWGLTFGFWIARLCRMS